jgi:diaminobutyrate-2-oxoglutarate transaminase
VKTFERLESEVRSYCRQFPCVFATASGSRLIAEDGREYVDFLAGAGVLNYGHNHPRLKARLIDAMADGLDGAEHAFREAFDDVILRPRGLDYTLRFPGPGGADAVEAALDLAREVTGRQRVIAFSNDFPGATIMPFDGLFGPGVDTLDLLAGHVANSGLDKPAAFVVETVQGHVNVARPGWLRGLERIAHEHGVLLIVDDTQAGCGRTGSFFSFEGAGITPDIVCLSKALSGYGLPMAVTLVRPDIDSRAPGRTFRGDDFALVAATAALEFWRTPDLMRRVHLKGGLISARLQEIALMRPGLRIETRGRGMMHGLDLGADGLAREVARRAFDAGLVIETSGPSDRVLKLLPPLTISLDELAFGLDVIEAAVDAAAPGSTVWQEAA